MDQAGFQQIAATEGAQGVFNYAKNNGISLDQLAQIGGVSTQEMANLAQSQGINAGMLSQIGYQAPAPAPVAAPAPTKEYLSQLATQKGGNAVFHYALANNLTMADLARIGGVTESEMRKLAAESDAFKGESYADAAKVFGGQMVQHGGGGSPTWVYEGPQGTSAIADISRLIGGNSTTAMLSQAMSDPYTQAYSSAFARNNASGGGFDFVNQMGGPDGFRKWVDAQPGGLRAYRASMGYQDADSVYYQPGGTNNGGTSGYPVTGQTPVTGGTGGYPVTGNVYSSFDPSTDTTRGQVDSMMQQDSEYLRNAQTKALQIANARGLLNSSMASESGTKAALDAATLIGDATANQYQKSKLTTQELNSRMDLANLDAASREKIAAINAGLDQQKIDSSNISTALSNYRAIAAETNAAINAILVSPTLTAEAKQTAIQNVLMRHDEYLTLQDALTGYKLADLVTYTE